MHQKNIKNWLKPSNERGFTIIEVMIVLAVAGLILAIIFIAIPQLQQARRDNYRKNYANLVLAQGLEFYSQNGALPYCPFFGSAATCGTAKINAAKFITGYLPEGEDPSKGMSYGESSTMDFSDSSICGGTSTPSKSTVFCWNDSFSSPFINHTMEPEIGQIVIAVGHLCNYSGTNTLKDQPTGSYNSVNTFSVVIGLESGEFYCVSNSTN